MNLSPGVNTSYNCWCFGRGFVVSLGREVVFLAWPLSDGFTKK